MVGTYAGLKFADLMKPQYSSFAKIPTLAKIRDQVVMGKAGTPTAPLYFAVSKLDKTGDGIVVAQDVRDLAADYCRRGSSVRFQQYTGLEHITGLAVFIPDALQWVSAQFAGSGRPSNCATLLP